MKVSELCGCKQCECIGVPECLVDRTHKCARCKNKVEEAEVEISNSSSDDLQQKTFYSFIVDVISIIA